ncbi:MAG: hypothetical protein M3Y31_00985 [Gemmatimonadota bacterium]|nr:hypothetical protein [Gemmatimonadota bacterium]
MPSGRLRPARFSAGAALLCMALLAGCEDRDRLVVPSPGDGVGPQTVIDQPGRDTTITGGQAIIVGAYSRDPDGLDTVYFRTFGPGPSFQPFIPDEGSDSVRLGLPIGTSGLTNDTIIILIFATDLRGNRGDTATRELYIP